MRHEAARHRAILSGGGAVTRQTRSFDAATGETSLLRDKEALLDYRFVPEPDIPPLVWAPAHLAAIAASVPELPSAARTRLTAATGPGGQGHGLAPKLAEAVVSHQSTLVYYEATLAAAREHALGGEGVVKSVDVANWVVGELVGAAKRAEVAGHKEPLLGLPGSASPARAGELLARVAAGGVSGRMAKQILAAMLEGDARPLGEIVEALFGGGEQIGDDDGQLKVRNPEHPWTSKHKP